MKLQVSNVWKSYGAHDVLQGADLTVKGNEKIALVGRNGCGKTTLLRCITKEESMDSGNLMITNGVRVGYLSQIALEDTEATVRYELMKAFDSLQQIEKELNEQAALLEVDASEKQLEKYARLQERFDALGGYDYEFELKNVFFHFGFEEEDLDRKVGSFSSGQRTRIALVRLLLDKPDVLLLDEPTNHLDVDSIEWLESYIKHYPSAVIVVSHDRMFLDRVADEVVEIEFGKSTRYPGNYTHFVQAKEDWQEHNHEAYLRQQAEIKRLEGLIEKFRYKKNKAAFAQSKIKYLDRMDRIEDSTSDKSSIHASFSSARKGGKRVLEVDNLAFGYDHPLSSISFELIAKDHLAIVGPNGSGKSTLIKTLMNKIPALGGEFSFGHQIDVGYFDQDSAQLSSTKTVIDELWDRHPDMTQTQIRNTLASFLFTEEEVFKDVSALSGGERVALALACLMEDHDNLLVLDEPTNHLDIPAREALEKALKNYDGTLIFVSHDRMFLQKMASRVLEIGPQSRLYNLNYSEYDLKKKEGTLQSAPTTPIKTREEKAVPQKTSAQLRQEKNTLSNRVTRLEQLLEEAEIKKEDLLDLRYEPEYYQDFRKMDELQQQIDEISDQIEKYTQEWEEKSARLEELSSTTL